MQFSKLFLFSGLLGASIFLLSNSGGRASVANEGNTGAPGENGTTCGTCHGNTLQTNVAISLLDASGTATPTYKPGQNYTVRVQITGSGNAAGHGFQLIGLNNANQDPKGFVDSGANNYKLKTISGGRTYVEHDGVSAANTFNIAWTAPMDTTVRFFAAGNRVNGNGNSNGDGAGTATATFRAEAVSSANSPASQTLGIASVFPNPVRESINLNFSAHETGTYMVSVFGLDGKVYHSQELELGLSKAQISIPAEGMMAGVYLVNIAHKGQNQAVRILKR